MFYDAVKAEKKDCCTLSILRIYSMRACPVFLNTNERQLCCVSALLKLQHQQAHDPHVKLQLQHGKGSRGGGGAAGVHTGVET